MHTQLSQSDIETIRTGSSDEREALYSRLSQEQRRERSFSLLVTTTLIPYILMAIGHGFVAYWQMTPSAHDKWPLWLGGVLRGIFWPLLACASGPYSMLIAGVPFLAIWLGVHFAFKFAEKSVSASATVTAQ